MLNPAHTAQPPWLAMKRQKWQPDDILAHLGIRQPPIDVHGVAEQLGVSVHIVRHPGWDGALKSDANEAHIWVNADHRPVRQRFTIAHELGHLMLHPEGEEFRDTAGVTKYTAREREANHFAAQLLMPEWMLRPLASKFGPRAAALAGTFQVSEQAMSFRLRDLYL